MRHLLAACMFIICFIPSLSSAGWLIYHKPAFEGQVLDGETKEPIEGAVVVVLYGKRTIGLGAGTLSSVINIRETLTDSEGRFHLPSYTTVIQPFSWEDAANFIIFKPGYVSIGYLYDRDLEGLFSRKMVGMQDQEFEWLDNKSLVIRYKAPNIVELPQAIAKEDRLNSSILSPYGERKDLKKQITLIRYLNEEWANLNQKD